MVSHKKEYVYFNKQPLNKIRKRIVYIQKRTFSFSLKHFLWINRIFEISLVGSKQALDNRGDYDGVKTNVCEMQAYVGVFYELIG